jgi:hypothetical protein
MTNKDSLFEVITDSELVSLSGGGNATATGGPAGNTGGVNTNTTNKGGPATATSGK